jgi:alcohol dehydrogenase class IV
MIQKSMFSTTVQPVPRLFVGKNAIGSLKQLDAQKVLVLLSPTVSKTEMYAKVKQSLAHKTVWEEIIPDAQESTAQSIASKYMAESPQAVVAIGGGVVLDTAKIIRYLLQKADSTLTLPLNNQKERTIPLALVATTPSTGSEVSTIAVLKRQASKVPYVADSLLADVAILDPNFLLTLGKEQLVELCADIIAHAYESNCSKLSNTYVRAYARAAMQELQTGFSQYEPNNVSALEKIQCAGMLAGIAQTNAFVGVCHALAHSLETMQGISHSKAILSVLYPCMTWHAKHGIDTAAFIQVYEHLGLQSIADHTLTNVDAQAWLTLTLADPSIKTNSILMKEENLRELIQWIQS